MAKRRSLTAIDPSEAALEPLSRDLLWALKRLKPGCPQRLRRYALLTFAAYVEGVVNMRRALLAQMVRFDCGHDHVRAELAALHGEQYALSSDGTVSVRPKLQPMPDLIRFVYSLCQKIVPGYPHPTWSSAGWRDFRAALELRNRVVHPRLATDVSITDAEIRTFRSGARWFVDETVRGDAPVLKLLATLEHGAPAADGQPED